MSHDFVAVHEFATVAQAIDHIRKAATRDDGFYAYVVDDHDHLVGIVPLHKLLTADPATPGARRAARGRGERRGATPIRKRSRVWCSATT